MTDDHFRTDTHRCMCLRIQREPRADYHVNQEGIVGRRLVGVNQTTISCRLRMQSRRPVKRRLMGSQAPPAALHRLWRHVIHPPNTTLHHHRSTPLQLLGIAHACAVLATHCLAQVTSPDNSCTSLFSTRSPCLGCPMTLVHRQNFI
jgi:hypothetical protein